MEEKTGNNNEIKKKSFFANILEKLDRKMKEKADSKNCCCKAGNKENNSCCS